jgi:hypothetical protein
MFYLTCHSGQTLAFELLQYTVEKVHRGVRLIVTIPSICYHNYPVFIKFVPDMFTKRVVNNSQG